MSNSAIVVVPTSAIPRTLGKYVMNKTINLDSSTEKTKLWGKMEFTSEDLNVTN